MKTLIKCALSWSLLLSFWGFGSAQLFGADPRLRLVQTIALEGLTGRLDHLTIDVKGERLFIAALGNDTVEVLDLRDGKRVQTLRGVHKPAGVLYIPDRNRLCVASGGDGSLKVYDATSYDLLKSFPDLDDADNLRYDSNKKLVYVGYGSGALAVIELAHFERVAELKLKGHPESFQLQSEGKRIYVNVPDARQVAVIDRERREQAAALPMEQSTGNFPMALDEPSRRLFIGCRKPAKLVILDSQTGAQVGDVAISDDTDDLFYDARRKRVYISCGEGFIDVVEQDSAGKYERAEHLTSFAGARTSYFSPESDRFYLAVPHKPDQSASIKIYQPK